MAGDRVTLWGALLLFALLFGFASCANILLYCPGDVTLNLCPQYATALSQMGHHANIKTTVPLELNDLFGVDMLIDGETAADMCLSSDSVSKESRSSFMGIGKPIFYQLSSTSFNACNQAKQQEINDHITDIPVPSGQRLPEGTCVMATDVGDRSCILDTPNDIAGKSVTCNSVNSFSNSLDANSALSFSNGDAYAGVWGTGDTLDGTRIIMWSGLGWLTLVQHPSFVDKPIFENLVTYLLEGCDLCLDATSPPVLSCPEDTNLIAGWGSCCGVSIYDVTATDADECSVLTGPTLLSGHPSGICVYEGDSVTYTVHDSAGNSDTCTWSYSITDYEPPIFTSCPTDTTSYTDDARCSGVARYETPTATDNCAMDRIVHVSGPEAGVTMNPGSAQVSYVALDAAGNANTCSFTLEMIDPYPPVITCPDDITLPNLPGTCYAISLFSVGVTDNCRTTVTQVEGLPNGSHFPVGRTTNRFQADDGTNVVECSFVIEVEDTEPISMICPHVVTFEDRPPIVYDYTVNVQDNCPDYDLELLDGPAPGDELDAGDYTVSYRVTDLGGFTASCTWTVDVGVATFTFPAEGEALALYTNYIVVGEWLADDEFVRIDIHAIGMQGLVKSLQPMPVHDMEFAIYDVSPGEYDFRFVGTHSNAHFDVPNIFLCGSFDAYHGCF